jgi:hypothetical protein
MQQPTRTLYSAFAALALGQGLRREGRLTAAS